MSLTAAVYLVIALTIASMFAGAILTSTASYRKASKARAQHHARRAAQRIEANAEHARQVAEHRAYMSQRDKTAYPFHA